MPFEIIRNNIADMNVDAIVNTVSPSPDIGSGVDSAIHKKAGKQLLEARRRIGTIPLGQAVATSGYGLNASTVIHTAGPLWKDGHHNEAGILASCYKNSLLLAKELGCSSIAFPLIATGNYGFPKPQALQIALQEISAFLLENEMDVYLVVFDRTSLKLSEKLFQSIRSYIDDHYIEEQMIEEYACRRSRRFDAEHASFDHFLDKLDAGFSETLLERIDRTGKKDSEIYKKANVDRKLFSKIRSNKHYKPSKTTALAFAFALDLDLDETKDLIGRAGYALSRSSVFDVIVEYFITTGNYDLYELNTVLFSYDQPLIGS